LLVYGTIGSASPSLFDASWLCYCAVVSIHEGREAAYRVCQATKRARHRRRRDANELSGAKIQGQLMLTRRKYTRPDLLMIDQGLPRPRSTLRSSPRLTERARARHTCGWW